MNILFLTIPSLSISQYPPVSLYLFFALDILQLFIIIYLIAKQKGTVNSPCIDKIKYIQNSDHFVTQFQLSSSASSSSSSPSSQDSQSALITPRKQSTLSNISKLEISLIFVATLFSISGFFLSQFRNISKNDFILSPCTDFFYPFFLFVTFLST